MTIHQANRKLKQLRIKREQIVAEIRAINDLLRKRGEHPQQKIKLRNQRIFGRYEKGATLERLASDYKLSQHRVRQIVVRMQKTKERNLA